MDRTLIIENDTVINIVIGNIKNGVIAKGNLEFAKIGDIIKNGKIVPQESNLTWEQKRIYRYMTETDPLWHGAMFDKFARNDSTALNELLAKINDIKSEIPKE